MGFKFGDRVLCQRHDKTFKGIYIDGHSDEQGCAKIAFESDGHTDWHPIVDLKLDPDYQQPNDVDKPQGFGAAQGDGGNGAPGDCVIVLNDGTPLKDVMSDALKIFASESIYASEHMRESKIHGRNKRPSKAKPDGAIWYQCKVCEFQDTAAEMSRHVKEHGIDAPVLAIMKTYGRV